MKKREKQVLAVVIIVVLVSIGCLIYNVVSDGQRKLVEEVSMDPKVIGTSLEQGISLVADQVERGKSTYPITQVMADKDNYACAIKTSYGPMSLKVKDGKIKEDILWSRGNTTAFIIGNKVYRYSPQYRQWLVFDYSPHEILSEKQMTYGVMSEFELINRTVPENVACVKIEISGGDFVFPAEEAVDLEEVTAGIDV